jgi:hypothetical protein
MHNLRANDFSHEAHRCITNAPMRTFSRVHRRKFPSDLSSTCYCSVEVAGLPSPPLLTGDSLSVPYNTTRLTDSAPQSTRTWNPKSHLRLYPKPAARVDLSSRFLVLPYLSSQRPSPPHVCAPVQYNIKSYVTTLRDSKKVRRYGGGIAGFRPMPRPAQTPACDVRSFCASHGFIACQVGSAVGAPSTLGLC